LIPTSPVNFPADLAAGRWDVAFFSHRFLGIEAHPGQIRFWRAALSRSPGGWQAAYLTLVVSAGNRAGKTLALAILILHNTVYKMGRPVPLGGKEALTWLRATYNWYHFGIQQETAELVFHEIVRILSGVHDAQQGRGCPLIEELGPEVIDFSRKDRGVYPWIVIHPALGGGQIHFRTTAEQALGSLGKDMDGISFDECAFEPQLEFVVNEVLHLRRLGTGGQLLLISTATEGLTAFADLWNLGDPSNPAVAPGHYSLTISTRENIGFGIDATTFERIVASMPEYLIPQNIDGGFIESRSSFFGSQAVDACFVEELPPDDVPKKGHRYAQGVDPALTFDSTWSITLDMTDPERISGVRARRKSGRQDVLSVAAVVIEGHRLFSGAGATVTTALDSTGFGGAVFRDILGELHPFRAVPFGGTRGKKVRLLLDCKGLIEKGRLKFPRTGIWLALRRQLLGYRLDDRKIEQDAVMALAVACNVVVRNSRGAAADPSFDFFATGERRGTSAERVLGRIIVTEG
jgi:hypothetical protein